MNDHVTLLTQALRQGDPAVEALMHGVEEALTSAAAEGKDAQGWRERRNK
jgi:hypothetical protein